MRRALFAGSFNPFTTGHADIVRRGLQIFDEVIIGIGQNIDKPSEFIAERVAQLSEYYASEPRVRVLAYDSLTADIVRQTEADVLLRGVRSVSDYEYEQQMADANRKLFGVETVLLVAAPELAYISSSLVRDLNKHGYDTSNLVI